MATSIKTKIRSGTLFLFTLLLLFGSLSIYYLIQLKNDSRAILKDNYESLNYCHDMQQYLDSLDTNSSLYLSKFNGSLLQQEKNVTEQGEQEATSALRQRFNFLRKNPKDVDLQDGISRQIHSVLRLNMAAINRKNLRATSTAENAMNYISIIAAIIFLAAFTFSVNFPSIITHPIGQLTEAIQEIANKNYKHRVHLENKDEFGTVANAFNKMAERLEYFESSNLNRLMFEKNRAEAVINSLKDASIGIDKDDYVLFANYRALQLLGLRAEDVVGKSIEEIKNKNDLFSFLIDKDTTTPFKIIVENRENYFVKEIVEVEQGESRNRVIVLKNITSYKELDVAKTNFIATISHELKTPLASSDFSIKLLEDERVSKLSSEQKNLISNLKQDNQRMLKILSELLNMSQVEAGRIELNIKNVSPQQIIENAMQAVAGNAKDKEIEIKDMSGKNLTSIDADAEKTAWVLINFLTNAIKYSFSNNSIEVTARQENEQMIFSVKDYGPGIDAAYVPRLFERYYQVPGSKEKGTGLGLAISKEFVDAQNGRIWVESEVGKGTTFSFLLPIKPA